MEFAQPALLFALPLVAAPWLLQLLLRGRARRVRFPAVGFLREAITRGHRKRRAQNYAILLARSSILGLAVVCLAAPRCAPASGAAVEAPRETVLILDDSLSTRYEMTPGARVVDALLADATNWVDAWRHGGAPGRVGLLHADPRDEGVPLLNDPGVIRAALTAPLGDDAHGEPLGVALRRAAAMLTATSPIASSIVIWSDGQRAAWRDVTPEILSKLKNVSLEVRSPRGLDARNLSISAPPAKPWLNGAEGHVTLALESTGIDVETRVIAQEANGPRASHGPFFAKPNETQPVDLRLPMVGIKFAAYRFTLEPGDRLILDQDAYFATTLRDRPRGWRLTRADESATEHTKLLLSNLIAPEALDPARQLLSLESKPIAALSIIERDGEGKVDAPEFILATDVREMDASGREALRKLVDRGAVLLIAPPAEFDPAAWGLLARWFSDEQVENERIAAQGIMSDRGAVGLDAPDAGVTQRIRAPRWKTEARALSRYADGQPAVLELSIGRGRALLLTTSPAPSWSDLGIRAAALLDWLYRALISNEVGAARVASLRVGQSDRRTFPDLPRQGMARVRSLFGPSAAPVAVPIRDGAPDSDWPTAKAGLYELALGIGAEPLALYTVNYPPEESDLRAAELTEIQAALGQTNVTFHDLGEPPRAFAAQRDPHRGATATLAWLLLAALVSEFLLTRARDKADEQIRATAPQSGG